MPMPRLMRRCGRSISSMVRWPMIRRSSSGMGRMCEAGRADLPAQRGIVLRGRYDLPVLLQRRYHYLHSTGDFKPSSTKWQLLWC